MSGKYILVGHRPEPVDLLTWAKWFESAERKVAETYVDKTRVSTVFLGLDHQFIPDGPPLIFETMVFGGPMDGEQERYTTWDEALAGHNAMVRRVEAAAP